MWLLNQALVLQSTIMLFLFFESYGANIKFKVLICFILVSLICIWFLSCAFSNNFVFCFFFLWLCRIVMYVTTLSGMPLNSHQGAKVLLMDYSTLLMPTLARRPNNKKKPNSMGGNKEEELAN